MHTEARPGYEALLAAEKRKSSFSSGAQECVGVGFAADLAGVIDTKNPDAMLAVPVEGFGAMIRSVKNA